MIRDASKRLGSSALVIFALSTPIVLSACNSTGEVLSHGYQLNEESLALVPEGSSREQVLLSLGTPSTKQTEHDGSETFYYISQRKTRSMAFVRPHVVDQRVLAIYMDEKSTVKRISNYGLKEGKVFDFVRRVTPTGGQELTFIGQILRAGSGAAAGAANIFGGR